MFKMKWVRNDLQSCIYCKDQQPKNKEQARRLKDTRANRKREIAIWNILSSLMKRDADLEHHLNLLDVRFNQ